MSMTMQDWTRGGTALTVQQCKACAARWYFRRGFCPECGAQAPQEVQASGQGLVEAVTVVHRAPTEAYRALTPYAIVLVGLDEGVRVMAHGALDLRIGDTVQFSLREVAGQALPFFQKA